MSSALRLLDKTSLTQPKILLVEDSELDKIFIKRIIESYYPFTIIDHVVLKSQACDLLLTNTYDVVFLDLNLPDTTGVEDVSEIKALSKDTPVIVFTGFYEEAMAENIKAYGIEGIVSKNDLVDIDYPTAINDAIMNIQAA